MLILPVYCVGAEPFCSPLTVTEQASQSNKTEPGSERHPHPGSEAGGGGCGPLAKSIVRENVLTGVVGVPELLTVQ
jgi:hypothetical protein